MLSLFWVRVALAAGVITLIIGVFNVFLNNAIEADKNKSLVKGNEFTNEVVDDVKNSDDCKLTAILGGVCDGS